jgi:quercetin dioxygenase-like cupin family protein
MKMARLCAVACALAIASAASAQDAVKAEPNNTKVVLENERVRVYEFWAKAGEKMAVHSHPDHLAYVIAPGKVKFIGADGKSTETEMKAGQALWVPATTHSMEILSGEVRAVVVELKK